MKPNSLGHTSCFFVIGLFGAALFLSTPTDLDFWWYDASRHAMNGVFLRDFVMDGGLLRPMQFATAYYQQYPAINIGFYPPFMYVSAVPLLILFGTSHYVSQVVVSLYACGCGVLVYLICLPRIGRMSAVATALFVMALPAMALWSRQVQLDVPAVALLLATAWTLILFLKAGRSRWLLLTAMFLGLAMLTRVQAVYAVPAVLLLAVFHPMPQKPRLRIYVFAGVLLSVLAFPPVAMTFYFSQVTQNLAVAMPDMPRLESFANWTWYARWMPEQLGIPGVAVTLCGLICAMNVVVRRDTCVEMRVVAAFALSSWLFFSIISNKEPRFDLPTLPFLVMIAVFGLHTTVPRLSRVSLPVLAGWMIYQTLAIAQVPVVSGFKPAVILAQQYAPLNSKVLISAHRDGSFIFGMRTLGARRDIGVRRADKLFVEINIMRQLGVRDRNLSVEQISKILVDENVSVIVAQTGYLSDQPTMRHFQQLLDGGKSFVVQTRIPMQGQLGPDEHELVVYRRISGKGGTDADADIH
ncbi:MAG: hypothetical protein NVSMB6_10060 [Burkholderiaceae bacterium]